MMPRGAASYRYNHSEKGMAARSRYRSTDQYRVRHRMQWRDRQRKLRLQVIEGYGGKCACCNESTLEFLTIDHVNNDGAAHRKVMQCDAIRYSIIKQGFPPEYQVLCWNCNCAKAYYGRCPHHSQRDSTVYPHHSGSEHQERAQEQ